MTRGPALRIATAIAPAMRDRLLRLWDRVRRDFPLREATAALERRDVFHVQRSVDLDLFARLFEQEERRMIAEALERVGPRAFRHGRSVRKDVAPGFRLDLTSPTMLRFAAEQTATLVREVVADQRRMIRDVIATGFREGIPPRTSARALRESIGLHTRFARAAMRYENEVGRTLIQAGVPETKALLRARQLADRYRERLLRLRAETIARHETLAAASEGERETWNQMQDAGLLSEDMIRLWIVATDERTCKICRPLEGLTAPLNMPFVSPVGGQFFAPPAHTQCRCSTGLVPRDEVPAPRPLPAFGPEVRTLKPTIPRSAFAA